MIRNSDGINLVFVGGFAHFVHPQGVFQTIILKIQLRSSSKVQQLHKTSSMCLTSCSQHEILKKFIRNSNDCGISYSASKHHFEHYVEASFKQHFKPFTTARSNAPCHFNEFNSVLNHMTSKFLKKYLIICTKRIRSCLRSQKTFP